MDLDEPNLMHYGIAVSPSHLIGFAEDVGALVYYKNRPTEICLLSTWALEAETLGKMCNWPNFKISAASVGVRCDMQMIVSFYTNYELENNMMSQEDEARIAEQVQDAFGLNEECKPMWFFEQGQWWPDMPE